MPTQPMQLATEAVGDAPVHIPQLPVSDMGRHSLNDDRVHTYSGDVPVVFTCTPPCDIRLTLTPCI